MMTLRLRERANLVGEGERFGKVAQTENAFQLRDSVPFDDLPCGNLQLEFGDFLLSDPRGVRTARRAF